MPRITLGIPIVGDACGEAFHHHLRLAVVLARHGQVAVPEVREVLPHDVARSRIVEAARQNESDLLYFVDDDTVVPFEAFEELYRVLRERNAVVVSGHYYRRGNPWTCVWAKVVEGEYHVVDAAAGVHEIDFSGLGCALIDIKWVLANLDPPYFTMKTSNEEGTIVTDDTSFYEKVRAKGGLILGDANPGCRCIHMGGRIPVCDEWVNDLRRKFIEVERQMKGLQNGNRSESDSIEQSKPDSQPDLPFDGRA